MNVIVLELILVVVVALGIGFWQLYDVNRELKKPEKDDPAASKKASADTAQNERKRPEDSGP